MKFAKRTHDVVAGRITQYRRPVGEPREVKRPGPRGTQRTGKSAVRWAYPAEPKVGRVFTVQREQRNHMGEVTRPAVHATITSVRREWLGSITFADARACGHRTTDDFKVAWVREHERVVGEAWALHVLGEAGVRAELVARFTRHHAAREVWVVDFHLSGGRDQFLAAGSRGGDYTTTPARALDPDAPCVDALTVARYAKAAEARAEAQRASFRVDLERERRARKNAAHAPPWRRAA